MKTWLAPCLAAATLTAVAVVVPLAAPAPPSVDLAVQGRANANPSVTAQGSFVAVAWAAATTSGTTDIYAAISRDAGRTFSTPARVNSVAGDASVSGEQPPRVSLIPRGGRDPAIVVMWTAKSPAGTRLLTARSDDAGKSFASSAPLPSASTGGNRGWESTAVDRDGNLLALWLDHRELAGNASKTPMQHGEHQHAGHDPGTPAAASQSEMSKLYFARLDDPQSARALLGGVCYCCKTSLATAPDGSVYAAWRHVYPGNIRDIAFTVSRDAGRTFAPPVRVSDDKWVLDGCPENGPALAVDARKRIHIVWPTLVPGATPQSEPTLALFYAMSRDGRTFTPRQRIATEGLPRHVQVAVNPGGQITVMWDEQGGGTRVVLGRGMAAESGAVRFIREPPANGAPGIYPVLTSVSGGSMMAWVSGPTGSTVIGTQRLDQ